MVVDRSGTNRLPWPSLARVSPNVQVAGGVAAIMGAAAVMWSYRRSVGTFLPARCVSGLFFVASFVLLWRGWHVLCWALPLTPAAMTEHTLGVSFGNASHESVRVFSVLFMSRAVVT